MSQSNSSPMQFLYDKKHALYFACFLLVYEISTYVANDMIMPGMLEVVKSFNAPETMVSTSLTAYILGGASLQLFLGPISDRFGRRPVMIFGVFFFTVCTMLIALSQNIHSFMVMRYFQGMGLCFIGVVGYAVLQEIFTEMYAVRLISIMNSITVLGPLAGPLLGSILIYYFSWQMIFVVIAGFALLALVGLWRYMPETVGAKRIDGSINKSTPLRFYTIKKNYGLLFTHKGFMFGCLAFGISEVAMISWIGTAPLLLMEKAKLSVLEYGILQVPVFLSVILGNLVMRKRTYDLALSRIIEIGSVLVIAPLLFMPLLIYYFYQSYWAVLICICSYAFGLGFLGGPLNRKLLFITEVPKGTVSALISVFLMIIIGLGNLLAGWLYTKTNYSNLAFGVFCAFAGLLYLICYSLFMHSTHDDLTS